VVRVTPLLPDGMLDLEGLVGGGPVTQNCWCMWFVIRVKEYRANGADGIACSSRR
jgi:hypothetical protein